MLSVKRRHVLVVSSAFLIVVLAFGTLYFNDRVYRTILRSPSGRVVVDVADRVVNQFDVLRTLQQNPLPSDSYVDLKLSGSDVQYITRQIDEFIEVGYIPDKLKTWREGQMHLDGGTIDVSFRFHGTSATPLRRGGFSLRIRHKKEGLYRDLMRSYNLITSKDDADVSTIWINRIAENMGLISPHGKMVILRINGVNLGLYMMVEELESEHLERNHGVTNYTVIKAVDDWDKKSSDHRSDLDLWVGNQEVSGTAVNSDVALGAFHLLTQAIAGGRLPVIKRLMDLPYVAKHMALGALINNSHSITGDNLRYIYDFSTGKFTLLFRVEDTILPIDSTIEDFNSAWFETATEYRGAETHQLFRLLLQDPEFRNARDQELHKIVQDRDSILQDARSAYEQNHPVILHSDEPRRR